MKSTNNKLPYTEAELLKGLTPENSHGDELPVYLDEELGDE